MTKSHFSDWSTTAANNTDVGGISLAEGVTRVPAFNNITRELMAQLAAAGFITTVNPVFADNVFQITDNVDTSKIWKVEASGITTATTRTATLPDKSGTLAMTSDIPSLSGYMQSSAFPTAVSLEGLSLVSGDVLYATAADTLARLAKGSDGQVLTLASGVPSWAAAASPGRVLLATLNTTGTTTQTTGTLSTAYSSWEIECDFTCAAGSNPTFNVSSDGGSSFDTAVGVTVTGSNANTTGRITIGRVGATANKILSGTLGAGGAAVAASGHFATKTSPSNCLRIITGSNLSSGNFYVYGVP
jgi:hypothetical protein